MARQAMQVSHPSQLADLSAWPWRRMRNISGYEIVDERIPDATRKRWAQDLRRHVVACGCDLAALGMTVGVIAYGAMVGVRGDLQWSADNVVGWLSFAVGGLIVGKCVGIARANGKLKRTVTKIQDEWAAKPLPPPDHGRTCG